MEWLDPTALEPILLQFAAASGAVPNNWSSLTLALIGIGTWVLFGIGRRSSRRRSIGIATSESAEAKISERRAA